jgi:hypothetical protein
VAKLSKAPERALSLAFGPEASALHPDDKPMVLKVAQRLLDGSLEMPVSSESQRTDAIRRPLFCPLN